MYSRELTILMAEDNEFDQLLTKELLHSSELTIKTVFTVNTLAKCISFLNQQAVDIVLLDLHLPDSGGVDTFIRVKKAAGKIPIIILSGLRDIRMSLEAISQGAQDYLIKGDSDEKILAKTILYSIERMRVLEALRESNERYDIISQATNDMVWDWDLVTGKVFRNKEGWKKIFKTSEGPEEPGEDWKENIHPLDLEKVNKAKQYILDGSGSDIYELEYRVLKTNGEIAYLHVRGLVTRNEQGLAVRITGATQDISERKKAEALLQQSYEEIQSLASHIETIREEERIHIAREIHDELGQVLTALKMDASWISKKIVTQDEKIKEKLQSLIAMLNTTMQTVKRISTHLRPSILDDLGLQTALEWQSTEFMKSSGISVKFHFDIATIKLPAALITAIFRIYQESLTSIARNSWAGKIAASLTKVKDNLVLIIEDINPDFNPSGFKENKTIGLLGIKERVRIARGTFQITNKPGSGMQLKITVPLATGI